VVTPTGDDPTATVSLYSGTPGTRGAHFEAFWGGGIAILPAPAPGTDFVVGRGETCAFRIDHKSVSRRHARIRMGNPVLIEDLGSHNGTRIDGAIVAPDTPTPIGTGSTVEVGSVVIVLRAASPAEPDLGDDHGVMTRLEQLVDTVARSSLAVVLLGETGVGKTRLAERVHKESRRAEGAFVQINCAALPEGLLESELFGHERGAFTGAAATKRGLLEEAHGGTLFLDEIGEMPLATQSKLLRVIESGEVRRIGATKPSSVDVRYVSATNRALRAAVDAGQFRADLFFRLDGISITVPPLRERRGEIRRLSAQFLEEATREVDRAVSLGPDALEAMERHPWPGNVRELRNVIHRSVLLAPGPVLRARDLHFAESFGNGAAVVPQASLPSEKNEERQRILDALDACAWNQTRAAKQLGISRRTLVDRLGKYKIQRPRS
jgi:transcriptional regulator with PAS, ATPase and Fis domain